MNVQAILVEFGTDVALWVSTRDVVYRQEARQTLLYCLEHESHYDSIMAREIMTETELWEEQT